MIDLVQLITLGLATWRISSMLVSERGPFDMFIKLRNKMGFVHDDAGHVIGRPDGNVLSCLWCTSIYVALGLHFLPIQISYVLAISTVAIITSEKLI